MINPYTTPGGKAMHYAYSLRVWLTGRKSKASYISDDKGFRVGSEVKVKLKKSRFGTEGRECTFKIVWAGDVGIQDQESWLEAIKGSDNIIQRGAWYELVYEDGSTEKFQAAKWLEKLQSENFKSRVMQIMDEEIIMRFEKKEGNAEDFYNVDPE
jgi:RecA/RadA recombinase